MVERQPSKLHTTVRSRSPAPVFAVRWSQLSRITGVVRAFYGNEGQGAPQFCISAVYVSVHEGECNAAIRFHKAAAAALVAQW